MQDDKLFPTVQKSCTCLFGYTRIDRLFCLSVIKLLTINLFFFPRILSFMSSFPSAVLCMDDYTFINAWVVSCWSNDPCVTWCSEHRLLRRCPLRNLLINSMVYVSGRNRLCRGERRQREVKDGDEEVETGGEGGGMTHFPGELIEHDSIENKMLRPRQNFSVTLQGSDTFFFWLSFMMKSQLCSVD